MVSKGQRAQQAIVEATITCIEARGLGNVTVRGIAKQAGVNVAAINYYFVSKENLIAQTLESTVTHMLEDVREHLARLPEDPHVEMTALLSYLLEGALRYPRLTQAHLHGAFIDGDYQQPFPRRFAEMLAELTSALTKAFPAEGKASCQRIAAQALSAVLLPTFFSGLFEQSKLFASKKKRTQYAADLATRLLPV